MSEKWTRGICFFLVVLLPATMLANDAVGMITVSGQVTIDGRPSAAQAAVFAGERIVTGQDSRALLIRRGTMVSLASGANVKLGARTLELTGGSVVVSSDQGSATTVDGITISTPPGLASKFLARRAGDELEVLAMAGEVSVSDGRQEESVPANKGVKVKLPKDSGAPAKMSWLHNDDIGILLVVAGGIAAGVTVGILNARDKTPASPAVP